MSIQMGDKILNVAYFFVFSDELQDVVRLERATVIIALDTITFVPVEKFELLLGFDAFGNNAHAQFMCHGDDRIDQIGVILIMGNITNEIPIDFDDINRCQA